MKGFSQLINMMARMFHYIDSGFIGWCGLMHRLFLRYQAAVMHNLSHQRIDNPPKLVNKRSNKGSKACS